MQRQAGSGDLAFLDGYLFRVMVQILKSEGVNESGLYNYYRARVEEVGFALSHYDRMLVDYVQARFDRQSRRIVHAGTGLGTLPCALAFAGYTVAALEQDAGRIRAASQVHAALADAWPAAAERYQLIGGEFPTVLGGTPWLGPKTVLIFTNCVTTWPDELNAKIMASLKTCGDVIMDTRLFGQMRDTPDERYAFVRQLEAQGIDAAPMAESPPDAFYYHLKPTLGAP
ncbi:MAG: hypothetical protein AB7F22_09465 [Reyranella sp.]|uniref:hypothetical protein n=1 Tax=Reyranella sp. TaxID=1929291 RepID=UPI003D120B65